MPLLAALGAAAACSKSASPSPPPPPAPRLDLVSTVASTTEATDTTMPQQFRLEVTLANVGDVPAPLDSFVVTDAAFLKGPLRVGLPAFSLAPDADPTSLPPGETRVLPFVAVNRNDHRCPVPPTCDQNPHTDLLDLSATVGGEGGAWYFRTPIVFTCENEGRRVCPVDLDEACKGTDVAGNPLRCLRGWGEVGIDRLCGLVESDTITYCVGRLQYRTIRVAGVDYQYHYSKDFALVGVTTSDGACVGGHCSGVPVPPPGTCESPLALYQCPESDSEGGTDRP